MDLRAVGVLLVVELLLLALRQVATIGPDVGVLLLFDGSVVRQKLLGLGRSKLAALQAGFDASTLVARPAIDLFTSGMVFGKAISGRANRIARSTSGGGNGRCLGGRVLVATQQPAVGILFLIDLPLLRFGQKSTIGFYVGLLLLLDGPIVRQKLLGFGRSELAAFQALANLSELLGVAVIDFMAARMILCELTRFGAGMIARSFGRCQRGFSRLHARLARV